MNFRIVGEVSIDWRYEWDRTRWFRFGLALFVTICLTLLVKDALAAIVTMNGKTCALPAGSYSTSPLLLPVCGGYFTCNPEGTAYLATATLVVQTTCTEYLFINGFEAQS